MAAISFQNIAVPETAAAVLRYKQQRLAVTTFKFRNEGANAIDVKVQDSDEGSTFADISGATKTLNVGGRDDLTVVPSKPYMQLVAGGNSYMKVDIAYEGMFLEGNIDLLVIGSNDSDGWPIRPSY